MRSCPKCRSSDYNNRNFVLLINECGHSLCNNCVDTLFHLNSAPCPTCGKTLRKNVFWPQTFDDPVVEKELYFRREMGKTFNLQEDSFPTLREYNDYLEMVEDTVQNLTHDIDVAGTYQRVAEFQQKYEDQISENRGRHSQDDIWMMRELENDKKYRDRIKSYRNEMSAEIEKKQMNTGEEERKKVIEELKKSSEPAAWIINNKKRQQLEEAKKQEVEQKKQCKGLRAEMKLMGVSEGAGMSALGNNNASGSGWRMGEEYVYAAPSIHLNGPGVPDMGEMHELGYLNYIRGANLQQTAGGYHPSIACFRALLDASSDLYYF